MSNTRNRRRVLLVAMAALAALLLTATAASARDGDPDPSFGGDGRVVAGAGWPGFEHASAMAIDPQGRIVVVAVVARMMTRAFVLRFNPDGSLDPSFDHDGIVVTDVMAGDSFSGLAIDAAGRVVLAGGVVGFTLKPGLVVARLLENGEPDPSFGEGGRTTVDLGGSENYGYDLALDGEGRILVAGNHRPPAQEPTPVPMPTQMVVLRLTAAGVLDAGFDEDGIALADFGGPDSSGEATTGRAIAIDPQGRILVAGDAYLYSNHQFAVAAFDSQGRPDPTLAGDGTATVDFGSWPSEDVAEDVALDPQGRIVLAGSDGRAFALAARLMPDGSPDASFAGDGRLVLPLPGVASAAGVAIDGPDRILVVGNLSQGEVGTAFLARLGQDGSLDGSFGVGGLVRDDYLAGSGSGADLAIDSAGRYLITGRAFGRQVAGIGVARYLNGEVPPEKTLRCRGKRATIVGTGKADRIRGTRGRDVVVALGGNDRIRSLAGRDLICAGSGRDLVRAGDGNDRVFGGPGKDRLFGGAGKDRLRGGPGRDVER